MSNSQTYERYHRQMILPGFGEQGQQQLAGAHVLVIGAGGLGCPALQYLVAAGVGHIGIADDDVVSLSNLHRQVLYNTEDIGKNKAEVAAQKLQLLNPDVVFTVYSERWQQQHCLEFFSAYDIIVDGTDNFATRYLINDACVLLNKPLVYGAVSQFEGQVAVFNALLPDGSRSVNYRHLFPQPPRADEVRNCAEAGVLGVLPGIIGTMQATEVIKLITGMGQPLVNQLLTYDALRQSVFAVGLPPNHHPAMGIPADINAYLQTNYEWLCGLIQDAGLEISFDAVKSLLHDEYLLVDVRERQEQPRLTGFERVEIPMGELDANWDVMEGKQVVFICQSGKRSMQAAMRFKEKFPAGKVYSVRGGVGGMMNEE
jgi:adenylyltransferase/sulfurtransferase